MVYVKVEQPNYLFIKTKKNAQLGIFFKKLDNKKLDNEQKLNNLLLK